MPVYWPLAPLLEVTGAKAFRGTSSLAFFLAAPAGARRRSARLTIIGRTFLVDRLKPAIAGPASEVLQPPPYPAGSCAPAIVGPRGEARLGQLARLVVASCLSAHLPLLSVRAAGPPDLEVGQVIAVPAEGSEQGSPQAFQMEEFLDQLMEAESGGRLNKKNPRSTALGPFQFIEATFLVVVNKHFPHEVAGLTERQVLARRTEIVFSRRVARAYANDLISALNNNGLRATAVNVRIAFLVGPSAAVRLLKTPRHKPLKEVLSAAAIAANPFMSGATVARLVQKAAGDVSATAATSPPAPSLAEPVIMAAPLSAVASTTALQGEKAAAVALKGEPAAALAGPKREPVDTPAALESNPMLTKPANPHFEIKCQIGLASCRKWIAIEEQKARLIRNAERSPY